MKVAIHHPHRVAMATLLCVPIALYACSGGSNALATDAGDDALANDAGDDALAAGEVSMAEANASDAGASRPAEASRDVAATTDAGVDGPAEAAAAGPDVVADAPGCGSIDQACADAGATAYVCMNWSMAGHASTWCSRFPNYRVTIATRCDGYDLVAVGGVDTSTVYYFDPQTGALLGVEGRTAVGPRCIAGTPAGIPLSDCFEAGTFAQATCLSDGAVMD